MATLVACLSTGKGTWAQVQALINSGNFDKTILVCNQWTKDNYQNENAEMILINSDKPLEENLKLLELSLKEKVTDIEVGLNLVSGSGIEHMLVLSALLRIGTGIRLVIADEKGEVKEI